MIKTIRVWHIQYIHCRFLRFWRKCLMSYPGWGLRTCSAGQRDCKEKGRGSGPSMPYPYTHTPLPGNSSIFILFTYRSSAWDTAWGLRWCYVSGKGTATEASHLGTRGHFDLQRKEEFSDSLLTEFFFWLIFLNNMGDVTILLTWSQRTLIEAFIFPYINHKQRISCPKGV